MNSNLPISKPDDLLEVKSTVKPKSVKLQLPKETEAEKELRLKREKLLEIKQKLNEPGGNFGVGIINAGHSYNKFATVSYD